MDLPHNAYSIYGIYLGEGVEGRKYGGPLIARVETVCLFTGCTHSCT